MIRDSDVYIRISVVGSSLRSIRVRFHVLLDMVTLMFVPGLMLSCTNDFNSG